MDGACSTNEKLINECTLLFRKPEGKRPLGALVDGRIILKRV
jgi:hypothetical protein